MQIRVTHNGTFGDNTGNYLVHDGCSDAEEGCPCGKNPASTRIFAGLQQQWPALDERTRFAGRVHKNPNLFGRKQPNIYQRRKIVVQLYYDNFRGNARDCTNLGSVIPQSINQG